MTPAIRDWWKMLGLIVLVWAALFALLHPTGADMVAIWERSETYAHGYIVLPKIGAAELYGDKRDATTTAVQQLVAKADADGLVVSPSVSTTHTFGTYVGGGGGAGSDSSSDVNGSNGSNA